MSIEEPLHCGPYMRTESEKWQEKTKKSKTQREESKERRKKREEKKNLPHNDCSHKNLILDQQAYIRIESKMHLPSPQPVLLEHLWKTCFHLHQGKNVQTTACNFFHIFSFVHAEMAPESGAFAMKEEGKQMQGSFLWRNSQSDPLQGTRVKNISRLNCFTCSLERWKT